MRQTYSAAEAPHPLVAQLGTHHRSRVLRHLRELSARDLWLRFGYAVTDDALCLYVRKLHFSRDAIFGILDDDAEVLALGHLGFDRDATSKTAEFGISVLSKARRCGLALRLLQRAAVHARNRGAMRLMMTYLPENEALKHLAQGAGMQLMPDAEEPRAYLNLEPPTPASLIDETFSEMWAAIDLGFRIANAEAARQRLTSA